MMNKTIHSLIFGFYIIFALLCGMGGFMFANISAVMTLFVIVIMAAISLSIHGFFIGQKLYSFGKNVILDVEDGHQHLQTELGNIRSVMDSFTDILDTVIDQQTSLDKKVDGLIKKSGTISHFGAEALEREDHKIHTLSFQEDNHQRHEEPLQHPKVILEKPEEFNDNKLPDFLTQNEDEGVLSGFSEEFMTYPVAKPYAHHNQSSVQKNIIHSMPKDTKDALSEEEFADVTDIMQNVSQHTSQAHIENEEFFEDITKMIRHSTGEKDVSASHIAFAPIAVPQADIKKQFNASSNDSVAQKPFSSQVNDKMNKNTVSLVFKNEVLDKKHDLPPLKALLPQEASFGNNMRASKSFIPESVPSLESLIKQEASGVSQAPVPQAPAPQAPAPQAPAPQAPAPQAPVPQAPAPQAPAPQAPAPQAPAPQAPVPQAPAPQAPVPQAPAPQAPAPQAPVPQAPVPQFKTQPPPQFKTQAPQAPVPVMKPAPEEEVKALPADNLSQIIRHALERNAIDTFIRPVIDSVSRETCYFEAYSYLRDAQEKHHPPKYFLPQAERDGLHTTIDRILLTRSVQIVRALQNAGQKVGVFSNISVKSVTDGDFMEELLEMVREKHDLSQGVVLEFSQRQLNYMTSMRIEKMTRLSSHGFVFSLDNVERPLPDLRELTAVGFRFLKLTPKDLDKGVSIAGKLVKGNEMKRLCNELNMKLVIIHVQDHNDMLTVMNYGADFLQGDLLGGVKRLDQLDLQAP